MTSEILEQMLRNQLPIEDILKWKDLEEWEESISIPEDVLYRCFFTVLRKEEAKLLIAINKQIHDTLKKTGKLPTIDEYKDLDKLIAIREEHIRHLIKMRKIYDTPAGEVNIIINEFCRLNLYVLIKAKIKKLTKSIHTDFNNKSDELNAICEVVKMIEKVDAELSFTKRIDHDYISRYVVPDCGRKISIGCSGNYFHSE